MSDQVFLFPDLPETNPWSFLQPATRVSADPLPISGYKVYAFLGRLDEPNWPFFVAPVPSPGHSCLLFQYSFPGGLPDFPSLGLEPAYTPSGNVLHLSIKGFLFLSACFGSISIKGDNWANLYPQYRELAAHAHLDLLPALTSALIRESAAPSFTAPLAQAFHQYYDSSAACPATFASVYSECIRLLSLFGFPVPPDSPEYCFGALRPAIQSFHSRCFPNIPAPQCLTPGILKQLRSFAHFLNTSLDRLGFTSDAALQRYQRAQGLPEGPCDSATLRRLWGQLLLGGEDPMALLPQIGIRVPEGREESETFGEINGGECDETGKRVVVGLSRSVSTVPAAGGRIAKVQRLVAAAAKAGAEQCRAPAECGSAVAQRIAGVANLAAEVQGGVMKTAGRVEASLRIVDALGVVNGELEEKLWGIKQAMSREVGRTNVLVMTLIALVMLLTWRWMGRKGT